MKIEKNITIKVDPKKWKKFEAIARLLEISTCQLIQEILEAYIRDRS